MTGRKSSSQKAKTAEPSGSRSQKSIDIIPAKPTTPDAPAPRETPAPAPAPAKPAKPAAKPAPLALREPEAPSSMSSMTKQLTAQNPDVLEPATNFVKGSAPRFDNTGAQDVVAKDTSANDELPMFGKQQAAENKEQKPEAPEVDYDDPKWDDMVKRVGQMAKQGPRKTVWDPVKRVYKTVPVNPVKEQEPGNRAGYNAIKSVSDWAEKLKTMRELQKDVSLMTDPAAKAAVQQRISELLKFGIQQGYVK